MSLAPDHAGFTREPDTLIRDVSLALARGATTDMAPKLGGLVEFHRSPARKQWTPTGANVPDHGKMAQAWWQNVPGAISGAVTPQQAMDGLARDQDPS